MSNIDNTNVSLNEHLSALLDDEAGAFEQRRILDELTINDSANQALSQKLASYSLIGESMRSASSSDTTIIADSSFLANIHAQIDAEPEYDQVQLKEENTTQPAANNKSWLRPVGGFALAASVAAIAVIGVQNYQQTNASSSPVIASTPLTTTSDAPITSQKAPQKTQLSVAAMKSATVVSAADIVEKAEGAKKEVVAMADAKNAKDKDNVYSHANARTRSLLKRYVDSHMQFASNTTFVPSVRVIAYSDN
ncbi:MAG: sigma-E factor negative regulatory protein [Cocleimonas sp.]